MKRTSVMLATASLLGLALVAAPAVTPVGNPASMIPVLTVAQAATNSVVVDTGAKLNLSPVDYSASGGAKVTFSKAHRATKRPVELQALVGASWKKVKTAKLNSKGEAVFKFTLSPNTQYRVYSKKFKKKKAVITPTVTSLTLTKDYGFNGKLPQDWEHRLTGSFEAGGRKCAAPRVENVAFTKTTVQLKTSVETRQAEIDKAKTAGCTKAVQDPKNVHKLKDVVVLRNAMLGTHKTATNPGFTVKTGIVAARIKFPSTRGMHGGVWLQSGSASEIDMIESYGWQKNITNTKYHAGLTSVAHVDEKQYPSFKKSFVHQKYTKSKKWWSSYHVFSVEWDRKKITYRIDGIKTQELKVNSPDANYFLVMSNLTSEFEFKHANPSKMNSTMDVDWVKVWATSQ